MESKYPCIAIANISGGPIRPQIKGMVFIKDVPFGAVVYANIQGLPSYQPAKGDISPIGPFGFHIHKYGNCNIGESSNPFRGAGGHWNPTNQPHGNHAGDFPVLFSNNGRAIMEFFTNKFKVRDVIGKSIIIHENPDDYRTQPTGNAGRRLACGVIQPYYSCKPAKI